MCMFFFFFGNNVSLILFRLDWDNTAKSTPPKWNVNKHKHIFLKKSSILTLNCGAESGSHTRLASRNISVICSKFFCPFKQRILNVSHVGAFWVIWQVDFYSLIKYGIFYPIATLFFALQSYKSSSVFIFSKPQILFHQ